MPPPEPDHEAARLYDSFGAALYRYALVLLGSREEAEDVIQQVFLALLDRGGGAIRDEPHYLRRAVRNACYSLMRHRKVRSGGLDLPLLEEVPSPGEPVRQEDRLALSAAILELPAEQREVVHLHVFEGLTFREVAEATGDSLSTVASRYRYAIEKLRAALTGLTP